MAMFSRDFGIDLGTFFTRISEGDQVILQEPTVVAVQVEEKKIVEIGQAALNMLGQASEEMEIARPLTEAVVALRVYLPFPAGNDQAGDPDADVKPQVMVTHPYGITSVEHRAVHEATLEALGAPAGPALLCWCPNRWRRLWGWTCRSGCHRAIWWW